MTRIKIKWIRLIGVWLVLLLAFGVFMVACQKAAQEIGNIASDAASTAGPGGDYKNIESVDWADRGYEDWLEAYPSSLLPERGELGISNNAPASVRPGVALPPSEVSAISRVVSGFLPQWETFTPASSDIASRIEKYSKPGESSALASREEAGGRWGVCAREEGCVTSSRWLEATRPAISIYAGGSDWALVRALGAIRYSSPNPDLEGQVSERRYGLLLQKIDGYWKVTRAVGSNGEIIILE